MKIAVTGYSGSGKSTLAKRLSEEFGTPLLYLDSVNFKPGWEPRDRTEALDMVNEFMKNDSWVIDGNYNGFLQERRLEEADRIIFMNFNRFSCFFRAFSRFRQYRGKVRESAAKGCYEKFDAEFARWILFESRTPERRRAYREMCQKYRDKTVIIKNQRELSAFTENPRRFLRF